MNVDSLPVGFRLDDPIFDESGTRLLDEGAELTEEFVQRLRDSGVTHVRIGGAPEPSSERGLLGSPETMDRLLEQIGRRIEEISGGDDSRWRTDDYDAAQQLRMRHRLNDSAQVIGGVLERLKAGQLKNVDDLQRVTAENLIEVVADLDLAIDSTLEMTPDQQQFNRQLQRQLLQSSILSLTVGLRLGMDLESLLHLGTAAVMADVALYRGGDEARGHSNTGFDDADLALRRQHPQIGFEELAALRSVPGPILQAVRQHHELMDGSGYPNGLTGLRITVAARIIGLTQIYLQLTQPIDGSEGILPADSVAYLMHHCIHGRFDSRVTKALVGCLSVYPIGSGVLLSDHREGVVLRASGGDAMQPLVRVDGAVCDLKAEGLSVLKPIRRPQFAQRRLPARMLGEILW